MSTNPCQLLAKYAALLAIGLLLAASSARAVTFNFDSDHCTGLCGPAPFGTVTLTQSGTTVDITVHLDSNFAFAKTGAADDQAFKFNGVDVSLSDIVVDPHIPGLVAATGSFNGDGTGEFDFGINCPTCGGGSDAFQNDIVFHVLNATIADLTQPNNLGNLFVADVINLTSGNTGPIDVHGPPVSTPDAGSTALLLGLGLIGLGSVRMPLRKKA
jgi:hypothetical protein